MKNIGLSYKDLENLGFTEYQHANLDLEEESSQSHMKPSFELLQR